MEAGLWDADQVASHIAISRWAVYKLARDGALATVVVGGRSRRFRPADVQAFIERRVA